MIIVEGMDGSGKSHLCYELSKRLGCYVLQHKWRPKETKDLDVYRTKMEWIDHYLQGQLILDRFSPISESVYGPIVRGTSLVEFLHLTQLVLGSPIQCIVFCDPPPEIIYENLKSSSQMDGVREHHSKLVVRYRRIMSLLAENDKLRILHWNYTTDSFDKLTENL